jgi:hypothetical protein
VGLNKAKLATSKPKWAQGTSEQRKSSQQPKKAIKPRSDKRRLEEQEYKRICDEIDAEAMETKQMRCYFCSKDVEDAEHHHLKGRDGDLLTDRRYIKRVHSQCHFDYHNTPVKKIKWFAGYLATLQWAGEAMLYNREREKYRK